MQRLLGVFFTGHLILDLTFDLVIFGAASYVADPFTNPKWHQGVSEGGSVAGGWLGAILKWSWLRYLFEYKRVQPKAGDEAEAAIAKAKKDPTGVLAEYSKEGEKQEAEAKAEIVAHMKATKAKWGNAELDPDQIQKGKAIVVHEHTVAVLGGTAATGELIAAAGTLHLAADKLTTDSDNPQALADSFARVERTHTALQDATKKLGAAADAGKKVDGSLLAVLRNSESIAADVVARNSNLVSERNLEVSNLNFEVANARKNYADARAVFAANNVAVGGWYNDAALRRQAKRDMESATNASAAAYKKLQVAKARVIEPSAT